MGEGTGVMPVSDESLRVGGGVSDESLRVGGGVSDESLRVGGGVIEVTNLRKRYRDKVAVDDVSLEPLSQRELEVLSLIAKGSTNREAAARLFISEATVKTHLLHIYGKLGVKDRAAAVAAAFERGLLTPGRS
jgi:DNA-binding CsgD family transcriptional regulator